MAYFLAMMPGGEETLFKTDAPIELTHLWCDTKNLKLKLYAEKAWLDKDEFEGIHADTRNRIIDSMRMRDDVYSEAIRPLNPQIVEEAYTCTFQPKVNS